MTEIQRNGHVRAKGIRLKINFYRQDLEDTVYQSNKECIGRQATNMEENISSLWGAKVCGKNLAQH